MTAERRYAEEEVAEIFERAASERGPGGRMPAREDGLSLAELQAIGGEAGIAPERIAQAAAALELRRTAPPRGTHLGMPVSVSRTVDLPRAPTDREWEMLVAELRTTFGAHGQDRSEGGLRAWRNGNLHVSVEPTDEGHRLRMGSLKDDGVRLGWIGIVGVLGGLVMMAFILSGGEGIEDMWLAGMVAAMGVVAIAYNAFRLPRWADEREEQMEHIAARAQALLRP